MIIPVICGPTAAGKSAVAMWLAQRWSMTIISADSRQVYRGFDVGTAKPTVVERERVPHRGIDVAEPVERYSAAQFAAMADAAIREALAAGRIPVVVGGTGFYIAALFRPLWQEPELDPSRRASLQRVLDVLDTDELRRWVGALDPARAHLGRAQLLRALEIALLTGQRLSELHRSNASTGAEWRASYLLVDPGSELQSRISARVAAMLANGWVEEVRNLMERVPEDAPAWNASGYEAVRELARGGIGSEAALERVVIETRQYAKRQRTWFRHQLKADPVTPLSPVEGGWQEKAERWIGTIERERETRTAMNAARGSVA